MKQIALAMLIVTVLAAVGGGVYGMRFAGAPAEAAAKPAPAEEKPSPTAAAEAASALVDLPVIVTNLEAPADTWVRLEASILLDPKAAAHPDALLGQISNDIIAFMRTMTLSQVQGAAGLQNLRQDLNERVATRSGGTAKELFIRALVFQ